MVIAGEWFTPATFSTLKNRNMSYTSVKEKLPDSSRWVIIPHVGKAWFSKENKAFQVSDRGTAKYKSVTHWQEVTPEEK